MILEAAEIHLAIKFIKNHQEGAQQVGNKTQRYTKTKPALPVDRETLQTAAGKTGTTETSRLSHLFRCSNKTGTKKAIPRHDTAMNAIVFVYTTYDFAWRSSQKERCAKRAEFWACEDEP